MRSFAAAPSATLRSTGEALALFDALEPVDLGFMLGHWSGEGCPTGHPLDGALEALGWQGKRFESPEHVHPLLFSGLGGRTVSVSPSRVAPGLPLLLRWPGLKSRLLGRIFRACLPLLSTQRSQGRLRLVSHRGRVTATLVYDRLPILDAFRRMDQDTVLGVMDHKGMERPFFFVLRRRRG